MSVFDFLVRCYNGARGTWYRILDGRRTLMYLSREDIQQIIPHREPILLVDGILEMKAGEYVVGVKNVSEDEPYFRGHFPGRPIMPGVLIVEALAQTGAVAVLQMPECEGCLPVFTGFDKVRFRRQVVPGDQLRLEVELKRLHGRFGSGKGRAYVGDELAAEAVMSFFLQGGAD